MLGALVGAFVGALVGAFDGALVGALLGALVGAWLGAFAKDHRATSFLFGIRKRDVRAGLK